MALLLDVTVPKKGEMTQSRCLASCRTAETLEGNGEGSRLDKRRLSLLGATRFREGGDLDTKTGTLVYAMTIKSDHMIAFGVMKNDNVVVF